MRSLHNLLGSHVSVKESLGPRTLAILQLSLTRIRVVNSDPPDLAGSQTVSLLLSIIRALNSCLLNLCPISCNYPIQHACIADQVRIGSSGLSLALLGECSQQDLEQLQAMQQQAAVQWRSPGHIGWSIVSQPLSIPTPQLLPEVIYFWSPITKLCLKTGTV